MTALNLERRIALLEREVDREREITSDTLDAKYAVLAELKAAQKRISDLETKLSYLDPNFRYLTY